MVGFLAAGGPSRGADAWDRFKNPDIGANNSTTARLGSASGNGRYQYWMGAKDAFETAPLNGRGAGSFESYWQRNATVGGRPATPIRCTWRPSPNSGSWGFSSSAGYSS